MAEYMVYMIFKLHTVKCKLTKNGVVENYILV